MPEGGFIFFVPLWPISYFLEVHVAFVSIKKEIIVVLRLAGAPKIPLKAEEVGLKWRKVRYSWGIAIFLQYIFL